MIKYPQSQNRTWLFYYPLGILAWIIYLLVQYYTSSSNDERTMIIGILIGVATTLIAEAVILGIVVLYRKWQVDRTFYMYEPKGERDNPERSNKERYEIHDKQAVINVIVRVRYPIEIQHFWFVFTSHDNPESPRVLRKDKIIEVTSVTDADFMQGRLLPEIQFTTFSDDKGVDGRYSPARSVASKEVVFFKVGVEVHAAWDGYLAFCSYGRDRERHYAFYKVEANPNVVNR